jgi:hypothetical protein
MYVGASLWGDIYRATNSHRVLRVLKARHNTSERRASASPWPKRARRACVAPVLNVEQVRPAGAASGAWLLSLEYQAGDRSLLSLLRSDDIAERVQAAVSVARCLSQWEGDADQFLLPTACDVFFEDHTPFLLPTPSWGLPDIDAFFENPDACLVLMPELLRQRPVAGWQHRATRYAIGALLHSCLYEPRAEPAVTRLERLAHGRRLDEAELSCTVPTWQQRLPGTKRVLQAVRDAVNPDAKTRAAVDLSSLANTLAQWLTTLDPQVIVQNLRRGGHSHEALTMVQELILNDPKPEHLLIAADLYAEDLGKPIEAIALYEAAIAARPGYGAAFSQQLRVLLDAFSMGVMPGLLRRDGKSDDDLDALIRRDFGELPTDEHDRFVEPMARYLLVQQRFAEVLKLVWAELYDRDKQFLWFKFGLRLVYLEAMLGLNKLNGIAEQLADIAVGLDRVEHNRSFDVEELRAHRAAHRALSDELDRRRPA